MIELAEDSECGAMNDSFLSLEQLLPPFQLAVSRILDLDPISGRFLGDFVGRILALADDSFQIHFDDFCKEQLAIAFDVIKVEHPGPLSPDQPLQHRLSFDQRQRPEILSVRIQQVKRDEDALSLSEKQIAERRPAFVRVKPDKPFTDSEGRAAKYLTPKDAGSGNCISRRRSCMRRSSR
jgi:hypothetical protein